MSCGLIVVWFSNKPNFVKACFDFARIVGTVVDFEIIPSEKLIQSIAVILSEDEEGLPVFRYNFRCFKPTTVCW